MAKKSQLHGSSDLLAILVDDKYGYEVQSHKVQAKNPTWRPGMGATSGSQKWPKNAIFELFWVTRLSLGGGGGGWHKASVGGGAVSIGTNLADERILWGIV